MKKYISITRGTLLGFVNYRFAFIANFLLNIVYIIFSYYLWQSIYRSSGDEIIRGLSFRESFTYVTMAFVTHSVFKTQVDWKISSTIMSGDIITNLLRPIIYKTYVLFDSFGLLVLNFVTIFIPSIVTMLVFNSFPQGLGFHFLFYMVSLMVSYMISYNIDFAIGIIAFYTESLWGIMTIKNIIITIFGGVLFPIAFLPDVVVQIIKLFPFYAMYHSPIAILTNHSLGVLDCAKLLFLQMFWWLLLALFNNVFYKVSIKQISINGG